MAQDAGPMLSSRWDLHLKQLFTCHRPLAGAIGLSFNSLLLCAEFLTHLRMALRHWWSGSS
jgi:hypothetical protein